MRIRTAAEGDLPAMVAMVEARRRAYEAFQPVFSRKAADSAQTTLPFFASLLADPSAAVLGAVGGGRLLGFLIAREAPAPPPYDPGGPTGLIDDFCVADPSLWPSVGRALLEEARARGHVRGWRQVVVVCGHADRPKGELLAAAGLALASTWWTAPL